MARQCSKPGCANPSVATLTFNYNDSMAVLGPLATSPEPHAYDLCETHARNLTAPRGWQIVRLQTTYEPAPPSPDDLLALVDAVRAAAHSEAASRASQPSQSERERAIPEGAAPTSVNERSAYATVTQLHPVRSEKNESRPPNDSHRESTAVIETGMPHMPTELGPFARPRPVASEEKNTEDSTTPEGHS